MTIRYKTTDLSKAIEYMRIHLRDKYFVSAYKRGIEYIVQISGVEEVKDTADTPQTDVTDINVGKNEERMESTATANHFYGREGESK